VGNSMNCRRARREMIPYLDGREMAAEGLQAHLDGCAACRRELEALGRSYAEIVLAAREQEPSISPSPQLLPRLNRRLDEIEEYSFWISVARVLRWLLVPERAVLLGWCAALVLLCLQLGQYVQIESVTLNSGMDPQLAETRIQLHLGDMLPVTLVSFAGA
jgi:hypothetical protein